MGRLTKINNFTGSWTQLGDKYIPAHNIKHKECVNKLGQLEDIEEELGIDLITLWKALKNGIFFISYCDAETIEFRLVRGIELNGLSIISKVCDYPDCDDIVYFKDYRKSWALTKEEFDLIADWLERE